MPGRRKTTLITTALLLASCSSTSAPSAAPTTTTPAVPAAAIPAVSTAAAGLAHDAIEFGDSGLELDRPADWRALDHWPVAGTGVGWELRAQAMPGPFECVLLTIDGQPTANACFRLADAGTAPVLPVHVGLTQTFDGKRFAYGVIEGADTPAVLDADPPVAVAALVADGGVRVFVTPVDRWATGGCETFTLLDALGVTRPGERPTVLPPVCRGDEADLYLLTHSSVNEDGRMVTFRRNADGMWRVAFDPWGVQSG